MKSLIIILGLTQILDVYLTSILLPHGYLEVNPIVNYILIHGGYIDLAAVKLLLVSFIYIMISKIKSKAVVHIIIIITSLYVALNAYQLREVLLL